MPRGEAAKDSALRLHDSRPRQGVQVALAKHARRQAQHEHHLLGASEGHAPLVDDGHTRGGDKGLLRDDPPRSGTLAEAVGGGHQFGDLPEVSRLAFSCSQPTPLLWGRPLPLRGRSLPEPGRGGVPAASAARGVGYSLFRVQAVARCNTGLLRRRRRGVRHGEAAARARGEAGRLQRRPGDHGLAAAERRQARLPRGHGAPPRPRCRPRGPGRQRFPAHARHLPSGIPPRPDLHKEDYHFAASLRCETLPAQCPRARGRGLSAGGLPGAEGADGHGQVAVAQALAPAGARGRLRGPRRRRGAGGPGLETPLPGARRGHHTLPVTLRAEVGWRPLPGCAVGALP
mmetsp:Transcript_109531/g.338076  ORF Transcript_109531/g.338076 Transcript_109531/m.338076 type:complete len:344 (+) Transcript_109531:110-1141(+)